MNRFSKFFKESLEKILGIYKNEVYIDLIKKEFDFLVQEYGFSMEEKISYDHHSYGGGTITYYSNTFLFEVHKGLFDDFSIDIKSVSVPPEKNLPLTRVIEYRTNREFTTENFLRGFKGNMDERLRPKIVQYAELLRKHCAPLLEGDFSWWPNAVKYTQKETDKIYQSLGIKNDRQPE